MSVFRKIFSAATGKPEQLLKDQALRKAALNGNLGRARALLDEGANPDYRDAKGRTPLFFAADQRNGEVVRLLLERGANPDVGPEAGIKGTALVQAACWGCFDMVKTLVEFKADLNPYGYEWNNPLFQAIWNCNDEIATFLVEAGASTGAVNGTAKTAFQDALTRDLHGTALALARRGAGVASDCGMTDIEKERLEGWPDVREAAEKFMQDAAEAARQAIRAEQESKAALEAPPVLQNAITVKKPIVFKSAR